MKSVLISIRPEWCAKIALGEKTVEVRKTFPKINVFEMPLRCFIYETKSAYSFANKLFHGRGMVIGEFFCDALYPVLFHFDKKLVDHPIYYETSIADACLSKEQIDSYANGKDLYGWHITDLKIYKKPKMKELKCCPFCGGKARVLYEPSYPSKTKWFVECFCCGACTRHYLEPQLAERKWNRRFSE